MNEKMKLDFKLIDNLRTDCALKQKKGLHFILASVIIWGIISVISVLDVDILSKNLLTFCSSSLLIPLAYMFSKRLKVKFNDQTNPLHSLGLLFSLNQMLYLLIVMWVYQAVPDKMIMTLAIVFAAHLLPFGWLYQSKSYTVASVLISLIALFVGLFFGQLVLSLTMVVMEILFSLSLVAEIVFSKEEKELLPIKHNVII